MKIDPQRQFVPRPQTYTPVSQTPRNFQIPAPGAVSSVVVQVASNNQTGEHAYVKYHKTQKSDDISQVEH